MELYEIKDGSLVLNLHEGQTELWNSDARFTFITAGLQSGKTSVLPWILYREIMGFGDYAGRGSGDYLAVTASFDLFKLKFLPELKKVFCDVLGIGRYWGGDRVIEIINPNTGKFDAERSSDAMWARIILRSAQSEGGLESATAKAAILDECGQDTFTLDDWVAIQGRLSLYQGRVFGATTVYNLGWMKTEVYDEWKNGNKDFKVIQFPSYINPAFPKAEYDRMEATLPEYTFAMRYKGMFAKPHGMIYKDFQDSMLVEPFEVPRDWARVIGLDFGGANTCKLWLAENPDDNRWYIYDCSLSGDMTTREHVEETKDALADIDDFTLTGGAQNEGQQRTDWIDNGLDVLEPSINNVDAGIDRVVGLIKTDRIRVFNNLRGVRDELARYSRKLDSDGEPTHIIASKRKFHRMDALRYAAVYITESDYDVESGNLAEMMRQMGRDN